MKLYDTSGLGCQSQDAGRARALMRLPQAAMNMGDAGRPWARAVTRIRRRRAVSSHGFTAPRNACSGRQSRLSESARAGSVAGISNNNYKQFSRRISTCVHSVGKSPAWRGLHAAFPSHFRVVMVALRLLINAFSRIAWGYACSHALGPALGHVTFS